MLTTHNRYAYSPIVERSDFHWPDGKRLAVYLGLNLEHFAFNEGLGGELAPSGPALDILNYAWRDYGNRVGVWRLLALFDELSFPVSVLANAAIYDYCPQIMDAFRARNDDVVAHGGTNSERQGALDETAESLLIAQTTKTISEHEKQRPFGRLGPWIAESLHPPDLLQSQGYRYLLDWCHDDQPTWFRTAHGPILSVPYPQELNDIPAIMVRRASAEEFERMIIANFDEMLSQASQQSLVMGIALHPYIVGQPFRLHCLRRALQHIAKRRDDIWFATAGAIADHIADVVPASA